MRVLLANNTAHYHSGCQAVMTVIRRRIRRQGHEIVTTVGKGNFLEKLAGTDYDALVVNGEGTLHHKKADFWIFEALRRAQQEGRQTYLVNTVWEGNATSPELTRTLASLDGLVVREALSARALSDLDATLRPEIRPDFSCFAPINERAECRDFGGREVCGDWHVRRGFDRQELAQTFPDSLTLRPRELTWSGMVRSLRTASLYVTGRHHGVYAACKARVPFVPYVHNCHKITGLLAWAKVSIPVPCDWDEILQARTWAHQNRDVYERLFDFLEAQPAWPGLG